MPCLLIVPLVLFVKYGTTRMKVDLDGSVDSPDRGMATLLDCKLTRMVTCTMCSAPNIHCRFYSKELGFCDSLACVSSS
jgi:hypothetical protein